MTAPTTMWTKLARRFGCDGNPLRRREDRIEAWMAPVAIVLFLALCPVVAIGTSMWAHGENAAVQRAAQTWTPVRAKLLKPAAGPLESDNGANTWLVWTPATWRFDGRTATGNVPAPAKSPAGSTITVELNRAGQVQVPPMPASQVAALADTATCLGIVVLALLMGCLAWIARRTLDRRRIARWETAWLVVEPRWTRQR